MHISQMKKNIAILCLAKCIYSLGFSVLFVSLALFLNSGLNTPEKTAAQITATFLAFNFGLPLLSGWLGNQYINFKTLCITGLLIQAIGYLLFSQVNSIFSADIALSLLLIGCMVFSVSIVEFITHSVEQYPHTRRTTMLLNYGSMNVGFIIGTIIAGVFSLEHHYRLLFILLGCIPLFCAFIIHYYVIYNRKPNKPLQYPLLNLLWIIAVTVIGIQIVLHYVTHAHDWLLLTAAVGLIVAIGYALFHTARNERISILLLVFFMLISIAFWGIFLLTPVMVMYLIKDFVNLVWHGFTLQPQWLDIDPIILMFGTPLLAYGLNKLRTKSQWTIPAWLIFSCAMLWVGIAAFTMAWALSHLSTHGKLSVMTIITYITCLAIAELFIAPEGYTLPGRLAPSHLRGLLTGVWVASISIGSLFSAYIAQYTLTTKNTRTLSHLIGVYHGITVYAMIITVLTIIVGLSIRRSF